MIQKILAIDDEPDMLRLLERIVTAKSDYKIIITNNPLELPELLEKEEFDLILTDLKMPGMDGLEVLNYVKENDRFEEVVMLTAFGTIDTAKEAMNKGAADFITKPFKKEQLLFTIERVMRWQRKHKRLRAFEDVLKMEPLDKALQQFESCWFRGLVRRVGEDHPLLAEKSGRSVDWVEDRLKQIGEQENS
ncbi:response regulator [bacterium]|nr:response regulator [bacterium]